jgi:N-acetylglucosamine kinase-like BadF-type ATPase
MVQSILIADSGATKTAWRLLENGKLIDFHTSGISPYHMSQSQIENLITEEFPKKILTKSISHVYYYGTGCKTSIKARIVARSLATFYDDANIHITHDLMGAAIATCGNKAGITCILGTGSNSCFYNGKKIVVNSPGLGYVLGDEASGAYFGKLLVQHFLYKKFDQALEKAFVKQFNVDKDEILHKVYRESFPNRFLANFAQFLSAHRGHYIIENIIEDGLREFFGTHLIRYPQIEKMPVHFVGSIAFHFQDKIDELCNVYGFHLGQILKDPMEGLTKFHQLRSGSKKK